MSKRKKSPSRDKEKRVYDNLTKVLLQFLNGKQYEPLEQAALCEYLSIPEAHKPLFQQILTDLLQKEVLLVDRKRFFLKKNKPELIRGILRIHPRGFGFLVPETPLLSEQDIFIPKHLTAHAVDGDMVEVQINQDSHSEKGPEGRVVSILNRGRTHLAGTILQSSDTGGLMAHAPLLGSSKPVRIIGETPYLAGDRVIMKVLEWGDEKKETLCEVTHLIGKIEDPSCDIQAAIEEYDLLAAFPQEVVAEAKEFGTRVSKKDLAGRENFTERETFTIDPDTAKDFDDALSLSKDAEGNYDLAVHIADVAHYVKSGSKLDIEASKRCNSTYFPGSCIPMLPEELSNQLCSLKEKVIRLTVTVLMRFDSAGTLLESKVVRSYIKSAKRFTYNEALLVLEGKKKSPHFATLKLMEELCLLLKKKRYERGSIDFSLPDFVIQCDEKGMPYGIKKVDYDITHQLVEEFMLKANEQVAILLSNEKRGALYRIHDEPSEENFRDFLNLARQLGFQIREKPTQQEVQKLFETAKGSPFAHQLSVGFIRSMKLANYSAENIGHYGLSLEYYCHFTSPIRRYTDLITARLLFHEEGENIDLPKIALKCSEQERISFRAESSVKTLKKLRLLRKMHAEHPEKDFHATVTKVKPFGLYFELEKLHLEGFIHISELENDYFVHDPERNILVGKSSGKVHNLGEQIAVTLLTVDFVLLESHWKLSLPQKKQRRKP